MKLHEVAQGTNPRRVTIYLAEKGIALERVQVDWEAGELQSEAFLAKNPAGKIPVLELDDGSFLPESAAIVEYLEERYPEPPMIGATPEQRARNRALERMANDLIVKAGLCMQHSHAFFAAWVQQVPEVANALHPDVEESLRVLDIHLGDAPFFGGDRPSIADCSLFAMFQASREKLDYHIGAGHARLEAWYGRFAARPSAAL